MKKLVNILGRAALGVAALLSVACQRDPIPEPNVQVPSGAREGYVSIPVSIGQAPISQTKGSMLNDPAVEAVGSGAIILVYMDGLQVGEYYFSQTEINNQASSPLLIDVPLGICDFYILGNLNAIHKTSGARVSLLDAYPEEQFASETALESLIYRLDGGDIGSTAYRRQTMAEIGTYGLPYRHSAKNVDVGTVTGIPGSNACKRLFSKVTVIIDHAAFDGGVAGNVGYFVNKSLYMRQVNSKLMPFSDAAVKATADGDLVAGAYNDAMTNAGRGTYVFYVPENKQGTVSGITKQEDKIASNIPAAMAAYSTYVEFTGTLDKAAGGFGGNVTYKFYLGANNTTDFNVERGKNYEVELSFTADGLFNPYWKVNASLTDSRLFALTADASFATDISSVNASRNLLVRKSRPGALYVYMNKDGNYGNPNALVGKAYSTSETMTISSLSDCAWYGALMIPSTADAQWLADRGITPDWDAATAKLTFTVTTPSKFESHIGESRSLSVRLLPNGETVSFNLVLGTDITVVVADGLSLTSNFYMGQKRTITVSGLSGTDFRWAAVQEGCGDSSHTNTNESSNRQWKTSSSGTDSFPTCVVSSGGKAIFNFSDATYDSQVFNGSLDIYAFYPNRFQSSHSGWSSKTGKIVIFGSDWLNDGVEASITISEPRLVSVNEYANLKRLPLDGTSFSIGEFGYKTFDGSARMVSTDFEPTLYNSLLALTVNPSSGFSDCVGIDTDNLKIFCSDSYSSVYGDLSAKSLSAKGEIQEGGSRLDGEFTVTSNPASGLFTSTVYNTRFCFTAPVLRELSVDGSNWSTGNASVFVMNYFKDSVNQYEDDESFWISCKYYFTNSDLASLNIAPSGNKTTYTVGSTTYEPIYEVQASSYDAGSGGILQWVYDESHQAKQAPTGEKIPGGLLLPYGEQSISFTFTNRHSGREITMLSGKTVTMLYHTDFVYFVGATARRYAQVFLVPKKNAKYLKRCAASADLEQRTWMTKLFGHRTWSDNAQVQQAYPYRDVAEANFHAKYTTSTPGQLPLNNFDVQYLPGVDPNATKWISSYLSLIDGQADTSGAAKTVFSPNLFSAFIIRLYDSDVGSLGVGLTGTIVPWLPYSGTEPDVQRCFLDTNQAFAQ